MSKVLQQWTFPAGERGVKVPSDFHYYCGDRFTISYRFNGSDSLIDLMLVTDALRREYPECKIDLECLYFPYARQDRKSCRGESHSLKVIAGMINSLKFDSVLVADPHSDVVEAVLNNAKFIHQKICLEGTVHPAAFDYFIAPDAGALKKTYATSHAYGKQVIVAQKHRNLETGEIDSTSISPSDYALLQGATALLIDDICDGGRTFIEIAKVLPADCKATLYCTHGIFSKGRDVLHQHFRDVLCYNPMDNKTLPTIEIALNQ